MGNIIPRKEWHIYSTAAITLASIFIIAFFFSGEKANFGWIITSIVTYIFGSSEKWKNQPDIIHRLVILFSMLAMVPVLLFHNSVNFFKKIITIFQSLILWYEKSF